MLVNVGEKIQKILRWMWSGKSGNFSAIPDPRRRAFKHPWTRIVNCLALGQLLNLRTLRDVEEFSVQLYGADNRISDTTLDSSLRRMDPAALLRNVVAQIRSFHRAKRLTMCVGMPVKIAMLDGKNLATLTHDADGLGHRRTTDTAKWFAGLPEGVPFWIMPALRAVLISTPTKPCVMQVALPPGRGECSLLPAMVDALHENYGRADLFEVFMMDAGLTSLANADYIVKRGYGYIMALKGNQTTLYAEAERIFGGRIAKHEQPAVTTAWEKRGGKRVRRLLWRTTEMTGFPTSAGDWGHLREAWYVRQETHDPTKNETIVEDRYFITSLKPRRCKDAECLNIVRAAWGIENDVFNSLDVQWLEDSGVWCTHGTAVLALGLLRILAYNLAQFVRRKILRPRGKQKQRPWRTVFDALRQAVLALAHQLSKHAEEKSPVTG